MAPDIFRRRITPDHAFDGGALRRRYFRQKRRKIDRRKSPRSDQRARFRALQEMPDLGRAKARVDMGGNRAEPRAGENQREIIDAVWQPQGDAIAEADAARGQ